MDFKEILNQWENRELSNTTQVPKKKKKENSSLRKDMKKNLDNYLPDSFVLDSKEESKPFTPSLSRTRMRKRKIDLVLDLHGQNKNEAKIELQNFIRKCYNTGINKILIIHGKGNHTNGQAVLKPFVKSILETSPYIGDIGTPDRKDGGSGATWAIVLQRSL